MIKNLGEERLCELKKEKDAIQMALSKFIKTAQDDYDLTIEIETNIDLVTDTLISVKIRMIV